MANVNATPTITMLGKTLEIREEHDGRVSYHAGMVTAVVIAMPNAPVSDAVMIGAGERAQFHHLDDCQVLSIG